MSALLGALLPLSFAPFHFYWLAFPVLAGLFYLWDGQTRREAAWRGFWFGFGAFVTGVYWLYISVHIFGGVPVWVALILMLGLISVMAMYVALAGLLAAMLSHRSVVLRWCVLWPAIWMLIEWLRGVLFSGFPWLSLGYSQIDGPLRGWAPVGGVYSVTLITVVVAGVLLTLIRGDNRQRSVAAVIGVLVAVVSWSLQDRQWTDALDADIRVRLLQGSISQDRKWLPEQLEPTLDLYRRLTFPEGEHEPPDLTIWPEVAVPAIARAVQAYIDAITAEANSRRMQLYLGVLTYEPAKEQVRNSLLAVGESSGSYHKRHLVPFGEFFPVPDFVREWMRLSGMPNRDTLAGVRDQPPLKLGEYRVAPTICYEDVFGIEQLDYLPEAHLLVNVSNDAWFGDSIAPHQHLQIARMRALEAGRYMLRTTNTGVTAIISPLGKIVQRSPQFRTHVLNGTIQPYTGATPYVRSGNLPVLWTCVLLILAGGYLVRRQQ
jgi:apolipoprotein N-acyltransferase